MFTKVLIWSLIFNFTILFMYTQYLEAYFDAQSDMLNTKFNLSTGYKFRILLFAWIVLLLIFCPFLYYVYIYVLHKSTFKLAVFISIAWLLWDVYPIIMTNNGYKIQNIFMNLFDTTYAGFIWVYISAVFYNTYCNIIEKSNIIILLLFVLNIFIYLLHFYACFIYNRKHTENNWLVKLGDSYNWDIIIKYIRYFKPNNKRDIDYLIIS